jgi:DedD protein
MPLPEFLRPKASHRPPAGEEGQAVQAARTRARQRLLGALVLLVVGVIAFPLLFETQPRPLATDTPIRLTQRDSGVVGGPAAAVPPATRPELPADAGVEAPAASSPAVAPVAAPASTPVVAPSPAPSVPQQAAPRPAAASAPAKTPPAPTTVAVAASAATRPEPKAPARPAPQASAAAATAAAASAATGRFVVQVGAFGDARTLREARQKVEKLGLKTYTQVIESAAGPRTRVRVGPFDSRSDAEAAAKRLQGGGLPAAILAL